MAEIEKRGAAVVGLSLDIVEKQAAFRDKYTLNMPLLADSDRKTAAAFGVLNDKPVPGIQRTTFIIGADGIIKKVFPDVKVDGHAEEVIQVLDSLG